LNREGQINGVIELVGARRHDDLHDFDVRKYRWPPLRYCDISVTDDGFQLDHSISSRLSGRDDSVEVVKATCGEPRCMGERAARYRLVVVLAEVDYAIYELGGEAGQSYHVVVGMDEFGCRCRNLPRFSRVAFLWHRAEY
jgi:hypothetical protein